MLCRSACAHTNNCPSNDLPTVIPLSNRLWAFEACQSTVFLSEALAGFCSILRRGLCTCARLACSIMCVSSSKTFRVTTLSILASLSIVAALRKFFQHARSLCQALSHPPSAPLPFQPQGVFSRFIPSSIYWCGFTTDNRIFLLPRLRASDCVSIYPKVPLSTQAC